MKQIIEIEVPNGKKAVWKDNKVVFEDIKPELPKTWEEYSKKHLNLDNNLGEVYSMVNKNTYLDGEQTRAHIAQIKLHLLLYEYRQGWEPDWNNISTSKYCIIKIGVKYRIINYSGITRFLSFQSRELAEEFLNNFRDLIEQAEDLI